ncbi:hypothetical protein [Thermosulfurimonas dismutans]|uniref:Putative lipoprotein n=1 Tax=Thermosulfurimonas dismutans TaxID=999894 RepID=A0A179D5V8_9BACT|nr:hypothetical protein [Thermosulfurimonas dismutans]OAQ21484.1 putative lipoprotein [Thermosulfurimonas dismutans]
MLKKTLGSVLLGLVLILSGCAAQSQGSGGKVSSLPKPRPILKHTDFPNLVLPSGLEIVKEKTLVVKTATFVGGVITLRGRVTQESVVTFFEKQLIARGWEEVGSIRYKNTLLAFRRPNGSCFVYIRETGLGNTEVKIWASEVLSPTSSPETVYP